MFTVRRKTTGHHTDHTREKSKDSAKDLKELLEAHGGHMRKDSTASASGGNHVRKGSFGSLLGKKLNDESSASSTPRNDLPTPRSESSTPRSGRNSLKGAVHKTAKVKSIGKQAEGGGGRGAVLRDSLASVVLSNLPGSVAEHDEGSAASLPRVLPRAGA